MAEGIKILMDFNITPWLIVISPISLQYGLLLPCLPTIRVTDRDSRTVIGRTRHVTSPIWSRIDWLTGPKIRIVGLSFVEVEMDKTVHLEFYLLLSGRGKHQFQ